MTTRWIQVGFVAYWVALMLFTIEQGQYPGFWDNRNLWSYPYPAVASVCLLLTLLLATLYLIVPATQFPYSRWRLGFAVAYAAVLFVGSLPFNITDQPAYYYVPLKFAAVTLAAVVVLAVVSVVCALNRRRGATA